MVKPRTPARRNGQRSSPWRMVRMTVLFFVLLVTGLSTWSTKVRVANWERTLWVAIYPINADGTMASARYIATLDASAFAPIDAFFAREAARYSIKLSHPVGTHLYAPVTEIPPSLAPNAGLLGTIIWSLKLRYWAWHATHGRDEATPDAQVFVLYHDPDITAAVRHSLGLEKGMLGVVYAFAAPRATQPNDVVIAHELMHTLGASDKYDPDNDAPLYPEGYAEPNRKPLMPQVHAEIMAGRMMLSPTSWEMPESLEAIVMGPQTASEIHWKRRS
jgi:hypothetical protein